MNTTVLDTLLTKLNVTTENRSLYQQAFTHRSYLNEAKKKVESNERLEFLGDSILSYLVSEYLYLTFPSLPEGSLTNLRSALVKTSALADVATTLHLGECLLLSKGEEEGGGRTNPSLLADAFEACIGALYLDQGIAHVQQVLKEFLYVMLPRIMKEKSYKDAKSEFQEVVQNIGSPTPVYKVAQEVGPDHAKEFTIEVSVSKTIWGIGKGRSKQEAEQQAATAALEKWQKKDYNKEVYGSKN